MSLKYPLPPLEERDRLLHEEFGYDPEPPACTEHPRPPWNVRTGGCPVCVARRNWLKRMLKRFSERGLSLAFDPRFYSPPAADPKPAPCPDAHTDCNRAPTTCEPCAQLRNWRQREYARERKAGTRRHVKDWTVVRDHLTKLRTGNMLLEDIARHGQCSVRTVVRILALKPTLRSLSADVAARLLAIPVPQQQYDLVCNALGATTLRVDSLGTHRRIRTACRAGHSIGSQAARLGYSYTTVKGWLTSDRVPADVARDVAHLYPALISTPGTDRKSIEYAARHGWPEARHFTADNIDDPTFQPMRRITAPGVRRRLRALAWMAQGPEQVAHEIGEKPADVIAWTDGRSHPAYIPPLIVAAYEKLSGRFGPAANAARHAREQCWPPPLAWQYIDIDHPTARAQTVWRHGDTKRLEPLQSQIDLGVMGFLGAADLIHPEKVAVVRRLHERGWSDRRIGVHMRWPADDVSAAVGHFRHANNITGYGLIEQWDRSRADIDFLVAPAR